MRCPSCKGAFPEGCSTCRPMGLKAINQGRMTDLFSIERGERRVRAVATEHGDSRAHTCPQCMRGLPCDPSSLSSLVGQIATHKPPSGSEWKRSTFPTELM